MTQNRNNRVQRDVRRLSQSLDEHETLKMRKKLEKRTYADSIPALLEQMTIFYPDWVMRIYHDFDERSRNYSMVARLCQLACNSEILDLCHVGELPGNPLKDARKSFPMNWRFFPSVDAQARF